ncbi:MAG: hypothetical protein QW734_07190 [Candidatus Bathyarchaeia archaeon]
MNSNRIERYMFELIQGLTEKRLKLLKILIDDLKGLKLGRSGPEDYLEPLVAIVDKNSKYYWTLTELASKLKVSEQNLISGGIIGFFKKYCLLYEVPKLKNPRHHIWFATPILIWIRDEWIVSDEYAFPKTFPPEEWLISILDDVLRGLGGYEN